MVQRKISPHSHLFPHPSRSSHHEPRHRHNPAVANPINQKALRRELIIEARAHRTPNKPAIFRAYISISAGYSPAESRNSSARQLTSPPVNELETLPRHWRKFEIPTSRGEMFQTAPGGDVNTCSYTAARSSARRFDAEILAEPPGFRKPPRGWLYGHVACV